MPKTPNRIRFLHIFACSVGFAGSVAGIEYLFDAFDGAAGPAFSPLFRGSRLFACSFFACFAFLIALGRSRPRSILVQEPSGPGCAAAREAETRLAKVGQFLLSAPKLTALLWSHLDETNRTSGKSALSVLEQISEVRREASRLLTPLAEVRAEAAARCGHAQILILSCRRKLDEMGIHGDHREGLIRDERVAIERTIALMDTLAPLTSRIGALSKRTRLLAFNAAIQATNDSSIGRGFVAVADEMRKLAVQIEATSTQVDDVMDRLAATVKDKLVGMACVDLIEAERDRMRALAGSMTRMSVDFEAAVSALDHLSTDLHGTIEAIFASIRKAQESSQSQDLVHQQMRLVQDGLAFCGKHLGGAADAMAIGQGADLAMLDDAMRTFEARYAMRTLHERTAPDKAAPVPETRPAIELF
jgi:methyl-accepting chemotaxis protein